MKKGDCWIDSKGRLHEFLGMRRGRPMYRMFVLPEQRTLALPDIFGTGGADSASYNSTTDDNTMRSEHATTYATARSGDGSLSVSGGGTEYVGQWKDGTAYILRRVQLPFNTSGLPDACSIDDGTRLRLYVTADYSATDFDVTVVQYSGAVPATATKTNWTAFGTTSGGATTTSGMATNAYLNINLTATGRGWVNPTGYTYLGVVSSRDISATAPTGNEYIFFNSYDAGSNRPTLEVYYTTNQAPNAPTSPTRADLDPANVARFTWVFSDPDAGDTQSAFKLRIRPVGGAWSYAQSDGSLGAEVWVNTANAYFDLAAHELDFSEDYEWQVATKDQLSAEGPYCAVQEFRTYDPLAWAVPVSPSGNADATTTPQAFEVAGYSRDDEADVRVRLQIDKAPTFDTEDLEEYVSEYAASGASHEFEHVFLGTDTWYWRVRGETSEDTGDWTDALELAVNTGGALPADYSPDPEVLVRFSPDEMVITWSAALDHALTPTAAATLRLQVQLATESEFTDPLADVTSGRVIGGATASVSTPVTAPGTYWVRFRTRADYGDDSAWDTYEVDVATAMAFVEDPSWQRQIGPRPNRVYCQIEGGVSYQVAEVPDVAAADKIDYWVKVPEGTSNGEALATAQAVLALIQGRPVSVSGKVPITIVAAFDRQVQAQWWEPVAGTPTLRETQTLAVAKKVHDVDAGTTELHLGDYVPPAEETIARLLAKLNRKI